MVRLDAALQRSLLQRARGDRARDRRRTRDTRRRANLQSPPPHPPRSRIGGQLRGCVGYPEPQLPLIVVVERCAVSAAIADPRFPAVSVSEWAGIALEISVLGTIETVRDIADVEVGRHGLIVERGRRRGLLLPQVATEWKWSAIEFASHACVKAGLPHDAWQNGATLYRFEADVFGESD